MSAASVKWLLSWLSLLIRCDQLLGAGFRKGKPGQARSYGEGARGGRSALNVDALFEEAALDRSTRSVGYRVAEAGDDGIARSIKADF